MQQGSVSNLVNILHSFTLASGLFINWEKSGAYWAGMAAFSPNWAHAFGWTWAAEGSITKLLRTPFGLSLSTTNSDQFLIDKVKSKLTYWSTTKLSLAAQRLIVNQVLMSTLWYFIAVWARSRKAIKQIQGLLCNYLWSGREHRARARVAWNTCTKKMSVGGLSLTDPQDALVSLMGKWMIKACEPGQSNLLTFLRYRLSLYKPATVRRWDPDTTWFMSPSHKSVPGSKI